VLPLWNCSYQGSLPLAAAHSRPCTVNATSTPAQAAYEQACVRGCACTPAHTLTHTHIHALASTHAHTRTLPAHSLPSISVKCLPWDRPPARNTWQQTNQSALHSVSTTTGHTKQDVGCAAQTQSPARPSPKAVCTKAPYLLRTLRASAPRSWTTKAAGARCSLPQTGPDRHRQGAWDRAQCTREIAEKGTWDRAQCTREIAKKGTWVRMGK